MLPGGLQAHTTLQKSWLVMAGLVPAIHVFNAAE
jgi:hypothetical protein